MALCVELKARLVFYSLCHVLRRFSPESCLWPAASSSSASICQPCYPRIFSSRKILYCASAKRTLSELQVGLAHLLNGAFVWQSVLSESISGTAFILGNLITSIRRSAHDTISVLFHAIRKLYKWHTQQIRIFVKLRHQRVKIETVK